MSVSAYYQLISREDNDKGEQIAYYRPNLAAQGAWNPHEQHMAPATGIICAELERFMPRDDMRYGRISLDIYGLIHLQDFSITTRCIRPGKTIELIESVFTSKEQTCIIARAWRMVINDTRKVTGLEDHPIRPRTDMPKWNGLGFWGGGYIESIKDHVYGDRRAGKGLVWLSNELEMVQGQPTSAFVKLMGMVDTANGVTTRQEGGQFSHMFPNLDLQIHLYRMPVGSWLGMAVQQQYGEDGIGLTSTVLHDEQGPFGHSEQILTVRPMPRKAV